MYNAYLKYARIRKHFPKRKMLASCIEEPWFPWWRFGENSRIIVESHEAAIACAMHALRIWWEHWESASHGGHLGRDRTIAKLKPKHLWLKMWADINNYVKDYEWCQKNINKFDKVGNQLRSIPAQHTCATSGHWSVLVECIQWWISCCDCSSWPFHQILLCACH